MSIQNVKVAILVANGFEQSEMVEPRKALDAAGATTVLISPEDKKVQGWIHDKLGDEFSVDVKLDDANPADYDALVLPGGVMNPDTLRLNEKAVSFVKHFVEKQKPISAICHGPWTLINAGGVKNYKMTSWASIQEDLKNAGATWVNEEVVVDRNLITSRNPHDLPVFNKKTIEMLSKIK